MTINMTINITEYSEHGLKIWYTLVHNITQYDDIYSNVFFHEIYNSDISIPSCRKKKNISSLIYQLKIVIVHSFLYVYQRV